MIIYSNGNSEVRHPRLFNEMYRDRAQQFKHRLGWNVSVNRLGEERDEYDKLNPTYVIVRRDDGGHGGSMRFLPTIGKTMINDYFANILGGQLFVSPFIWECTRFCLSPKADPNTAVTLIAAGAKLATVSLLMSCVAVFDNRMMRIYKALGLSPDILCEPSLETNWCGAGLWEFSDKKYRDLIQMAGLSEHYLDACFENSMKYPGPNRTELSVASNFGNTVNADAKLAQVVS